MCIYYVCVVGNIAQFVLKLLLIRCDNLDGYIVTQKNSLICFYLTMMFFTFTLTHFYKTI